MAKWMLPILWLALFAGCVPPAEEASPAPSWSRFAVELMTDSSPECAPANCLCGHVTSTDGRGAAPFEVVVYSAEESSLYLGDDLAAHPDGEEFISWQVGGCIGGTRRYVRSGGDFCVALANSAAYFAQVTKSGWLPATAVWRLPSARGNVVLVPDRE